MKYISQGKMKPYSKRNNWRRKFNAGKEMIIGSKPYSKSKQQRLIARNANRSVKKAYRQELKNQLQELIEETK